MRGSWGGCTFPAPPSTAPCSGASPWSPSASTRGWGFPKRCQYGAGRVVAAHDGAGRAYLLLGHRRHGQRRDHAGHRQPVSVLPLLPVLHPARRHPSRRLVPGGWAEDLPAAVGGAARDRLQPGPARVRRVRQSGDERQLPVPALSTARTEPSVSARALALVHLLGRDRGDRDLRPARRPFQNLRPRTCSIENRAVSATSMTAITPASTGSVTTRSAASGTEPAMLVQTTMIPASRISRTAFEMSPPMSAPASTSTRARCRRATARTASAS